MMGPAFIHEYAQSVSEYEHLATLPGESSVSGGSALSVLEIISKGNRLFDLLSSLERHWYEAVLSGREDFGPEEALAIRAMFEDWLAPAPAMLDKLRGTPESDETGQFRRNIQEARNRLGGELPCLGDPAARARWAEILRAHYPDTREIRIADDGQVFEADGLPMYDPGVTPVDILQGLKDLEEGRTQTVEELRRKLG